MQPRPLRFNMFLDFEAAAESGADEDGAISRQPVYKQTMNLSVSMLS